MMKNLRHYIQTCLVLALAMVSAVSCSDDVPEAGDVQVSFTATLPAEASSRAFGEASQVNTLVVGVFNAQKKEIYRQTYPVNGSTVDVELTLAQNQTYHFVFWAYNDNANGNIYNISNLTAIKMTPLAQPVKFSQLEATDAFYAVQEKVVVAKNKSYRIELIRPLAQINVGTSGRPVKATLKSEEAPNTFHPFTHTVSGQQTYEWRFNETTTETFSADGTSYNYLALGYLFAPTGTTQTIAADLVLDSGKTFHFPEVKIQANFKSNIGGGFTSE